MHVFCHELFIKIKRGDIYQSINQSMVYTILYRIPLQGFVDLFLSLLLDFAIFQGSDP